MSSSTKAALFPVNSLDTAPAASRSSLLRLKESVGAIPNLAAAMATSPLLIEAFVTLRATVGALGTFSRVERELISLTNAVENGCGYCTAIHTLFALKEGASPETVSAIRGRGMPANPRDAALIELNRQLLRERGQVNDALVERFTAAGFTAPQVLELIASAALSTLANFAGRLTHAPLDEMLKPHAADPVECTEPGGHKG